MTLRRCAILEHSSAFDGIISEAARCVNTKRPLTHSLDLSKEGLVMHASRAKATHTCSDPECNRDVLARGMCEMHYSRWRKIQHASGGLPPQGPSPKFVDRTGLRCGLLTVIARAPSRPSANGTLTYWLCRCDCGNEVEVRSTQLSNPETSRPGKAKSCGCLKRKPRPLPGGRAARNRVLRYYRQGASRRGLCWELSDADFDRLITQSCIYCGQPPTISKASRSSALFYCNGIDRVDSALGYAPGNSVSCCRICNKAKGDMPYGEFMAWIGRLTEYQAARQVVR